MSMNQIQTAMWESNPRPDIGSVTCYHNTYSGLVGKVGLEPTVSQVSAVRFDQLSYIPILCCFSHYLVAEFVQFPFFVPIFF